LLVCKVFAIYHLPFVFRIRIRKRFIAIPSIAAVVLF